MSGDGHVRYKHTRLTPPLRRPMPRRGVRAISSCVACTRDGASCCCKRWPSSATWRSVKRGFRLRTSGQQSMPSVRWFKRPRTAILRSGARRGEAAPTGFLGRHAMGLLRNVRACGTCSPRTCSTASCCRASDSSTLSNERSFDRHIDPAKRTSKATK